MLALPLQPTAPWLAPAHKRACRRALVELNRIRWCVRKRLRQRLDEREEYLLESQQEGLEQEREFILDHIRRPDAENIIDPGLLLQRYRSLRRVYELTTTEKGLDGLQDAEPEDVHHRAAKRRVQMQLIARPIMHAESIPVTHDRRKGPSTGETGRPQMMVDAVTRLKRANWPTFRATCTFLREQVSLPDDPDDPEEPLS